MFLAGFLRVANFSEGQHKAISLLTPKMINYREQKVQKESVNMLALLSSASFVKIKITGEVNVYR